ncbi:MAG: hypothetical protein JKY51_02905 [Opitutaceae bacterium]|nr:hypothetical protein [Opitutaceae bacterium]
MISWLQTRFQKHYQVLFIVLLAVLIVSFVFTIGEFPGLGSGQPTVKERNFFGTPLNSEKEQRDFFRAAEVSAYLQTSRQRFNSEQIKEYAFHRATTLHLADQLHIPNPTEEQKEAYIQTLPIFMGTDGVFDLIVYNDFLDNLSTSQNLQEATIARIIIDDYRMIETQKLLGGPGYALPSETSAQLARTKTKWTVGQATLEIGDLSFSITPSEEELIEYFKANTFSYEIPEKMEVTYVAFNSERYFDQIDPPDEAFLQNYFELNKTRFKKPRASEIDVAQPDAIEEEATFEEVRTQVELEIKLVEARNRAIQEASDFAYNLFEKNIPRGSGEFSTAISTKGLVLKVVPAFSSTETPEQGLWNQQIVNEAFKLSEKHWFSDPLSVGNSTIIIFYNDRLISYIPEFNYVRDTVTKDFRAAQEKEQFIERGKELQTNLSEQLAAGNSFSDAAEKAGLKTQTWPAFTLRAPPSGFDYSLLARLEQISAGEISDMIVNAETGTFLYVESTEVPKGVSEGEDFDQTSSQLAQLNANTQQNLIIREMLRQEITKGGF